MKELNYTCKHDKHPFRELFRLWTYNHILETHERTLDDKHVANKQGKLNPQIKTLFNFIKDIFLQINSIA